MSSYVRLEFGHKKAVVKPDAHLTRMFALRHTIPARLEIDTTKNQARGTTLPNQLQGFRLLELRCHGRGPGVHTNGQYHSDRVGEPG